MRHLFLLLTAIVMTYGNSSAQLSDTAKIKTYERQLDDVMELVDTNVVKSTLVAVEQDYQANPSELNSVRLGLIYHETALNLSFLTKTEYKGYAQKSYDVLSKLYAAATTTPELMPFIASYRASALSLVGAETKKLALLGKAFAEFATAVEKYGAVSAYPEFLRGSVSENLPWFFFNKRKFAKTDFQSIIAKQEKEPTFASPKLMSFTYWAWAKKHSSKKERQKSLAYLEKAIQLDPNYQAGRQKAEELKKILDK